MDYKFLIATEAAVVPPSIGFRSQRLGILMQSSVVGAVEKQGTSLELLRLYSSDEHDPSCVQSIAMAASLLQAQWPRGGPFYREKMLHPSTSLNYGLPCSYLLLRNRQCIGHGRLTECFEGAAGNACAATYIVIQSTFRKLGYGNVLMTLLEEEAERLGYHYVYLWTQTAVPFYVKIGYVSCHRVSLYRGCLKQLEAEQISTLEGMLRQRKKAAGAPEKACAQETILLPPSDGDDNQADVWLRKRLIESIVSRHIPLEERLIEIRDKIAGHTPVIQWFYTLQEVPWQQQVGPSCGLAALRMVRDFFRPHGQMPSLLSEARENGYSRDGEMFDANHLQLLAENICGLKCEMASFASLTPFRVFSILKSGGVLIIPYDSNSRTKLPCKLEGRSAHYGIIVGLLAGFPCAKSDGCLYPLTTEQQLSEIAEIYLLVQHSLSSQLAIAMWFNFLDSNQQLATVDKAKFGSPKLDLKDRVLICHGVADSGNLI